MLRSDPRHDAVCLVVVSLLHDWLPGQDGEAQQTHVLLVDLAPRDAAGHAAHDAARPDAHTSGAPAHAMLHAGVGIRGVQWHPCADEQALFATLAELVREADPDILLSWEVQRAGLGYLVDRATALDMSLVAMLSRTPEVHAIACQLCALERVLLCVSDACAVCHCHVTAMRRWQAPWSTWTMPMADYTHRACTSLAASSSTCGACCEPTSSSRATRCTAALRPCCDSACPASSRHSCTHGGCNRVGASAVLTSPRIKTTSKQHTPHTGDRWRCIHYVSRQNATVLRLLHTLDILGRTSELARTFGIDFFSVLVRGSQYRVESMLLRLAHTQNYLALSPSREQVARQPAMECIPLVMEPQSTLYVDPVVVLDFQSLYPSMIIAYNLCYSTCCGRVAHAASAGEEVKLGVTSFALGANGVAHTGCLGGRWIPPSTTLITHAERFHSHVCTGPLQGPLDPSKLVIAPNGVAFAPPDVRPGVVPRMLREILATRVMVKAAMKRAAAAPHSADTAVRLRCLNARQLALKLIANVTYGYASAGFSGAHVWRVPLPYCVHRAHAVC